MVIRLAGLVLMCIATGVVTAQYEPPSTVCYRFEIDAKTPVKDLLPTPPKSLQPTGPLFTDDLTQVPMVELEEPLPVSAHAKLTHKLSKKEEDELTRANTLATLHIARQVARINFLNQTKMDRFIEELRGARPDLAGLPFVMGEACRMEKQRRRDFSQAVTEVNEALAAKLSAGKKVFRSTDALLQNRSLLPAMLQIAATERTPVRLEIIEQLQRGRLECGDISSVQALTRLALFSQETPIREAAAGALKKPASATCATCHGSSVDLAVWERQPTTDILLHGLRYPWPSIAQNAAELIVQLQRDDLVPELKRLLDEPDPRVPVVQHVQGKDVVTVRELVRINHHRNCLLCHAPGNTPDVLYLGKYTGSGMPEQRKPFKTEGVETQRMWIHRQGEGQHIVVASVPLPSRPFVLGSGYYFDGTPDIFVRADVTYLRQDFSRLILVADARPWPEMQRFDYLVRSRELSPQEALRWRSEFSQQKENPYRRLALNALSEMKG